MRILISGSRGWNDPNPIGKVLDAFQRDALKNGDEVVVIHGGARGADSIAHSEAVKRGIRVIVEKADWDRNGKAAGPIRNQLMLDKHDPHVLYAFRSHGRSTGTDDMVRRAQKKGVLTYVVKATYDTEEAS